MSARSAVYAIFGMCSLALWCPASAQDNPASPTTAPSKIEQAYWNIIKDRQSRNLLEQYLTRFPHGEHAAEALAALQSLPTAPVTTHPADDQFTFRADLSTTPSIQQETAAKNDTAQNHPNSGNATPPHFVPNKPSVSAPPVAQHGPGEECGPLTECKVTQEPERPDTPAKPHVTNTTPPASAQGRNEYVLTLEGLGELTGKTQFTLAAIKKALPGYDISEQSTRVEGILELSYRATKDGKLMLLLSGNAGGILGMTVYDTSIRGPKGVRVGDRLSDVVSKVGLGDCIGGYDEMADRVNCSPAKDDDVFSFRFALKKPLPPISDDQALTAKMLPPTIRLSEIDWQPRDPATPIEKPEKPTVRPSEADATQQLMQQADAIMDHAYQMDVSLWGREAKKALEIYRHAADKGSVIAFYKIGELYENGIGVSKDNNAAIRYFEKAAKGGYLPAYARIMLVQDQFRNFAGAAKTFFRFHKASPPQALQAFDDNGYSTNVGRAIQEVLKDAGYYRGSLDGQIGPGTRKAIVAYVQGEPRPAMASREQDTAALAGELQRQLLRVGCYHGAVDGMWGNSSIEALRNFSHWSGQVFPAGKPTKEMLKIVAKTKGRVCGID